MRLMSRFTCKLNVERNGIRLLSPLLQSKLFTISVHEAEGALQFSVSLKAKSMKLPSSPYLPRRFTHKNIHKISTQCTRQGRMSISLLNYHAAAEGFRVYENPSILTVIYITEGYPESLESLAQLLACGPSKRTAIEAFDELQEKRRKNNGSFFDSLGDDVLRIILQYVGESKAVLRLVSRKWMNMLVPFIKKLKIKNPKDAPGEVIVRIIKKNPFVQILDLSNCRNLAVACIKSAITLPLKRVKVLSLRNCVSLNTSGLGSILRDATRVEVLDLVNCKGATDQLVQEINRNTTLKCIKKVYFSAPFTEKGVASFVEKYPNLVSFYYSQAPARDQLYLSLLSLKKLREIEIYYTAMAPSALNFTVEIPLVKLILIPLSPHFIPDNKPMRFIQGFSNSPLTELGCTLSASLLSPLLRSFSSLKTLHMYDIPIYVPLTLSSIILHSDGHELNAVLRLPTPPCFSSISSLFLYTNSDLYVDNISASMKCVLAACKFAYLVQRHS